MRKSGHFVASFWGVTLVLLFWPSSAISMFYRLLHELSLISHVHWEANTSSELARLQSDLEIAVFARPNKTTVFDFRNTFLRYTGLALESDISVSAGTPAEIFEISMHPDPAIASACLNRKNRSQLMSHRDKARTDFIEIISSLTGESSERDTIAFSAIEAAKLVGDEDGVSALRSALGISEDFIELPAAADGLGELWKTASQSHSIAN